MNNKLRRRIVEMAYRGQAGHIPSALSVVEILHVLYRNVLAFEPRDPSWLDRDYFILSKGHGCMALYAVLEEIGVLDAKAVDSFCQPGSILGEHPDCLKVPGVEASTGSLGHGLSLAVGLVLGLRIRERKNKVYVLIGDGECNEGTVWEAALVASHLKLGNLCCIVDANGSPDHMLPVAPLQEKWQHFGWETWEVDGHDELALKADFDGMILRPVGQPVVVIAHTVKGKGVSMMEGQGTWHHRVPTEQEYTEILEGLR